MNRQVSQDDIQIDSKHIQMLKITNHQRNANQNHNAYNLTPVRMAVIKKSGDNRCWRGWGEIGMLLHCFWETKLVLPLWKTVWRVLKDLELEIPFNPAIPLLGVYRKDYKSFCYKNTCTHMFIEVLFTIAKNWNQPKCSSMIVWIKKMWHIYTMEYYAAIKKNKFIFFTGTWSWKPSFSAN